MSVGRVVIAGGGASGVLTAVRLLSSATPPRETVIVDGRAEVGRGVAYSTEEPAHLLNVPAARMSALPEEPDHFVRWLDANAPGEDPAEHAYASRRTYGAYLAALLRDVASRSAGALRIVNDVVTAIDAGSDRAVAVLASGQRIDAERVILALGSPPARNPFAESVPAERVVPDPWATGALSRVPRTGDVFILGSGLTMIDVVLALEAGGHRGTVHVVSRRGLLPRAHPAERRAWPFAYDGGIPGTVRLRDLVRTIREEVARAAASGATWHDVLDTLRPLNAEIWSRLPSDDRRRFLRHLRPYWDVHRHRMAPSVAGKFAALCERGVVRLTAGRLDGVTATAGGLRVAIVERATGHETWIDAVIAINATGAGSSWRPGDSALVDSLFARGLARRDELGLGIDTTPEGFVIDAGGNALPSLLAIGPLRRGTLWETTAVPDIREHARHISRIVTG